MYYPALIEPDEPGWQVSFRDIPEALTGGATREEAEAMAADALLTAMDFYFEDGRPVPPPSRALKGETLVALPASVWLKILLLNELAAQGVSKSELARRMGASPQVLNSVTKLAHPTKIDTIERALRALGKELVLSVR